ncbi:LOW QUALITY PROTEIN: hypothetical protein HID58_048705 [Brassica napus]|uniref:Auxin-responsive protein n=1 Tax=Brassica napus TaxID=3708 RepID=A0ABQ8B3R0_BRANA|nr:LOW QUALITY PROTEIN: hypothetical protein HID58_048705 [Brassica napus]
MSTPPFPSSQIYKYERAETGGGLKKHNYLGISDCSSYYVRSSTLSGLAEDDKAAIRLKATDLTLGFLDHDLLDTDLHLLSYAKLDERPFLPLVPLKDEICPFSSLKNIASGNKSSVYTEKKWTFPEGVASQYGIDLGWPPVRSFRKNTLATTCSAAFFVKVSMDGAPYLRKVDLISYTNYMELSTALEKMFTTFTLGQCGSNKATRKDKLCETKLKDLLNGKDSVLTYEDKDGDWMLVGDVPWEMFIDVCKKKIMKGCDAIRLAAAPRAMWRNRR